MSKFVRTIASFESFEHWLAELFVMRERRTHCQVVLSRG
jgi:hypothetical protein